MLLEMLFSHFNILFSVVLLCNSFNLGMSWDYQNFDDWGNISPTCNSGQRQSPINFQTNVEFRNHRTKALEFLNYNEGAQELTISNNGHTVQLSGTWNGNEPSITGTIFSKELYVFSNFHVHWGTMNNNGTDHAIDGQKYTAELHLVHLNRKYRNRAEALKHVDGIAVVGIIYEINDSVLPNPGMMQFATDSQEVLPVNSTARVETFDLVSFIPDPLPPLYSYFGSLTTPPCTEDVRWVVLSEPQPITSEIIELFRNVVLGHGDMHNIRPLQPTNNRLVELYNN